MVDQMHLDVRTDAYAGQPEHNIVDQRKPEIENSSRDRPSSTSGAQALSRPPTFASHFASLLPLACSTSPSNFLLASLLHTSRPLSASLSSRHRRSRSIAFVALFAPASLDTSWKMANLGVPVKLLHESLGHVITVELKTGEVSLCLKRRKEVC